MLFFLEPFCSCEKNASCLNCLIKKQQQKQLAKFRTKIWLEKHIWTKNGIVPKQDFEKGIRKLRFKHNFYNI